MYSKKELSELKTDFWEGFSRFTSYYSIEIGEDIKWMYYKTRVSGLEFKFELEKKYCSVIIEVNGRDEVRLNNIYNDLISFKSLIISSVESEIIWEAKHEINDRKFVSRVYIEQHGLNYLNRMHWPELYRFMAKNMLELQLAMEDVLEIFVVKYGK